MTRRRRTAAMLIVAIVSIAAPAAQQDIARLLDSADALLLAKPAEARQMYERALAQARETAREAEVAHALIGLAQSARIEGRAADGRDQLVEALAIADRIGDNARTALAAYRLGQVTPDIDAAGVLFERAAVAARAAGNMNLAGVALHSHGDDLFGRGRYEESLGQLLRAAAEFEAAQALDDLGTVYNSIGRIYRAHGRLDEALRYQKSALELHRKHGDPFSLLQSLNAVSVVYQRMSDFESGRAYLEEALAVSASLPATRAAARAQDFLRANMAAILSNLGQLAPAAAALEQVIADGRDDFPGVRYQQLASVYLELGRPADALAAAEKAVALCGDSKVTCIQAYLERSNAHAGLGHRDAALDDLSLTLRTIEEMRAQLLPSDFFKQGFSSYYGPVYSSAIARQLDAGRDREALESAELGKSRALLDLLASRSVAPAAAAKMPVMPLTLRGGAAPDVASPVTMPSASADELIRTAARLKSSLLLYWVGATETIAWVVRPDGVVQARRIKIARTRLAALVRDTAPFAPLKSNEAPTLRDPSAAWRRLHTLLIEPVRAALPRTPGALVTIVPHDVLANLSFAALQDGRGRYLLEDYTLHYARAGALFQFTAERRQTGPRSGALLMVSDPDAAPRSSLDAPLPRLPGARIEAAAITRQFPAGQVQSLTGAAATETAVRAMAPARSILHFAAHTVVRDDDPFASYLALSTSGGGGADGVLTAQDVYGLNVPADLVVLSSCRSASGTVAGDGVATFARAFLYAGTASLVASLWEVADEPSNRLLPAFYRAWLGGATKAAALRRAQLQILADLRAGRVEVSTPVGKVPVPNHPVFWAGFALFGEPD